MPGINQSLILDSLTLSKLENNRILYAIIGKKLVQSSFGESIENEKRIETRKIRLITIAYSL